MADRLVTVYHPLGWPVVVGPARAEVFRARGYTDEVAEPAAEDAPDEAEQTSEAGESETAEPEQAKPARRTRATR